MLSLLAGVALAGGPTPVERPRPAPAGRVSGAEAAEYVRQVIPQVQAVANPVRAQLTGVLLELGSSQAEQRRLALCSAAKDGEAKLAAVSPFPSDDALREAGVTWARTIAAECEGDLAKWIALRKPVVADADVAAAAEIGVPLEERLRRADAAWYDTVAAFSERHGVRLTLNRHPLVPEWDGGAAPEGTQAPPRMVAQLAAAYVQQLEPPVKGVTDAYESWRAAVVQWKGPAGPAHTESKAKTGRALAALGRIDGYLGDAALIEAARQLGAAVSKVLDGEGAGITEKSIAGPTSQREVEALNQRLTQCDAEIDAATQQWNAAVAAFQDRWGVPAYQEWLKTAFAPR